MFIGFWFSVGVDEDIVFELNLRFLVIMMRRGVIFRMILVFETWFSVFE